MKLRRRETLPGLLGGVLAMAGCASIGPGNLDRDQLGYTRSMADSSKRQTLFNLVRMRFGEAPTFVAVNQLVSSYSLQSNGSGGFAAFSSPLTNWGLLGGLQYTDTPTFTLQPVTGDQFVEAYLRPLSPDEVLPLMQSGVPVDKLFWLAVQKIGPLHNTQPLARGQHTGSPNFQPTLDLLRRLQEGGGLGLQVRKDKSGTRAYLLFETAHLPHLVPLVREVYRNLAITPSTRAVEVFYGHSESLAPTAKVPIMTRSLLAVMAAVAAEIDVPQADIAAGRTGRTLREPGQARPMLIVHSGPKAPERSYSSVQIDDTWYWVADNDFRSKIVFATLQLLKAIAESTQDQSAPVLTIPTR
jgi:hypothetical protein